MQSQKRSGRMGEKLPPHNEEAEQWILGGILMEGEEALYRVTPVLKAEYFYRPSHRSIYEACHAVALKGLPIDLLTVKRELEVKGLLTYCGGAPYLAALVDDVPTAANIEGAAKLVREQWVLRRLREECLRTIQAIDAGDEEGPTLLAGTQSRLLDIDLTEEEGPEALYPVALRLKEDLERAAQEPEGYLGLSTGFIALDNALWGLHPGELIVLAGRTSMGKTTLAMEIAKHLASTGHPALVFSLEMTKRELSGRVWANLSGINPRELRRKGPKDWERLARGLSQLENLRLYVDQKRPLTFAELRARAYRARILYKIELIVVDYFTLIPSFGVGRPSENRHEELSRISKGLKHLAGELKVPILLLSQINRQSETRNDHRPHLRDLRECGALEEDADVVLFLHRPSLFDPLEDEDRVEVIIEKHRSALPTLVELRFNTQLDRLEEAIPRRVDLT